MQKAAGGRLVFTSYSSLLAESYENSKHVEEPYFYVELRYFKSHLKTRKKLCNAVTIITDNVEISGLRFGRYRIELTHVFASVRFLHVINMQIPRPMLIVGHRYPRIPCNHVTIYRQYG